MIFQPAALALAPKPLYWTSSSERRSKRFCISPLSKFRSPSSWLTDAGMAETIAGSWSFRRSPALYLTVLSQRILKSGFPVLKSTARASGAPETRTRARASLERHATLRVVFRLTIVLLRLPLSIVSREFTSADRHARTRFPLVLETAIRYACTAMRDILGTGPGLVKS